MLQYSAALDIPYSVRGMAGPVLFFFLRFPRSELFGNDFSSSSWLFSDVTFVATCQHSSKNYPSTRLACVIHKSFKLKARVTCPIT